MKIVKLEKELQREKELERLYNCPAVYVEDLARWGQLPERIQAYVNNLEDQISDLKEDNNRLAEENESLDNDKTREQHVLDRVADFIAKNCPDLVRRTVVLQILEFWGE